MAAILGDFYPVLRESSDATNYLTLQPRDLSIPIPKPSPILPY
jgi:hypothetical protein